MIAALDANCSSWNIKNGQAERAFNVAPFKDETEKSTEQREVRNMNVNGHRADDRTELLE